MHIHMDQHFWLNTPKKYEIADERIVITTDADTDLWQRTYYGFRVNNAPALLFKTKEPYFSFSVKCSFNTTGAYDQCGVILYQNDENWMKASIEYENESYQRLGSVVTNHGYSDWATTDIDSGVKEMHYRLSRRESDFRIESSSNGMDYTQMRIFHLFEGGDAINVGIYACSPTESSFDAIFTELSLTECQWNL